MRFMWFASIYPIIAASPVPLSPLSHRGVDQLDQEAFEEAQQPDETATKAFAGTLIKTADGQCLSVNKLSGDFRANLTPVQIAECGSTDGQNWDIITNGKHNNAPNAMLVVNTLTNACLNFDPRRPAGNQVILFSCGGRADGGGDVTDSQLFPFNGGAGPLSLSPGNQQDSCMTVSDKVLDVTPCQSGDLSQLFTLGDALSLSPEPTATASRTKATDTTTAMSRAATTSDRMTATSTSGQRATAISSSAGNTQASEMPNPTKAFPVSGAGGVLQPTAAAEAHQRDDGATRAFNSVRIKSPDGKCLSVDPTAGDFRENLIPISLVTCGESPNEKFDIITAGKHNNAENSALIVSSLTNGCMSFDGRRQPGDTVTIFSCGGRADGGGETNNGQLVPFNGRTRLVLAPESERNVTCIVPGKGRLDAAPCTDDDSQVFTILT
ncbi:hypothetical protein GGS20DRAFT_281297 [Poronia punctata]|nr:hypothetical protein GGS20DRAFT_281297 [Poronia punctata]